MRTPYLLSIYFIITLLNYAKAQGNEVNKFLLKHKEVLIPTNHNSHKAKSTTLNVFEMAEFIKAKGNVVFVKKISDKKIVQVNMNDLRINFKKGKKNKFSLNDLVLVKIDNFFYKGSVVKRKDGTLEGRIHEFKKLNKKIRRNDHSIDSLIPNISVNDIFRGNCRNKNLIKRNPWDLKTSKMPQYSQGPDGICYAYAGMQLIDFYNLYNGGDKDFFNINRPFLGNAIFLGLKSRIHRKLTGRSGALSRKNTLSSGRIQEIINAAREFGYCKDSVLKKSIKKFLKGKKVNLSTQEFYFITTYFFETFFVEAKDLNQFEGLHIKKIVDLLIEKIKDEDFRANLDGIWEDYAFSKYNRHKPISISTLNKKSIEVLVSKFIENNDYIGFLDNVFKDCNKKENIIKFNLPKPTHLKFKRNNSIKDILKIINNELSKSDSTGLGISYCSAVLRKGGKEFKLSKYDPRSRGCGNHASIIIGQRMRAGRCQILLRNTWGFTGCSKYNSKWECQLDKEGKENGVWVDGMKLSSSIYALDFFKAKNKEKRSGNYNSQRMKFENMMKALRKK